MAYGDIDDEEQDIFRELIARNARNMNFENYEIIFTSESMTDIMVTKILEQWEKS